MIKQQKTPAQHYELWTGQWTRLETGLRVKDCSDEPLTTSGNDKTNKSRYYNTIISLAPTMPLFTHAIISGDL